MNLLTQLSADDLNIYSVFSLWNYLRIHFYASNEKIQWKRNKLIKFIISDSGEEKKYFSWRNMWKKNIS